MSVAKTEIESTDLKIMRLRYEAQSVQFSQSERMSKKRQLRQLEKEKNEWIAQNTR